MSLEYIQPGYDRGFSQLALQCCKQPVHVVLFKVKLVPPIQKTSARHPLGNIENNRRREISFRSQRKTVEMGFERLKKGFAMPPFGGGQSERFYAAVAFQRGGAQDQDGISRLAAAEARR
jgi:hypothetical protein